MFSTRPSRVDERLGHGRRVDLEHGGDRRVPVHDARAAVGGEQGVDALRVAEPHPVGEDPEELVDRARRRRRRARRASSGATSSTERPSAR